MEKIKEAIERAAEKREFLGSKDFVDLARPTHTQQRSFQAIKAESVSDSKIAYPISYESTHVHEVDEQWLKTHRVLHAGSDAEIMRAYKLLRTQVLKKLASNDWNSLGVIGARSGQGSTLTAINLAVSIAMEYRYTVMLADFNLRTPMVHEYFNFEPVLGVSDYILHDEPVQEMLFNPGIESLVVLPGREAFDNSSERLMSPKVQQLVEDIKHRYPTRIVIFDLPPLLESDDAIAFIDQFDAGLLVIEEAKTTKSDIKTMSELLGDKPILGTILNNASG